MKNSQTSCQYRNFVIILYFYLTASGDYDQHHQFLRSQWHATTSRLLGKNKINQLCDYAAGQLGLYKLCSIVSVNARIFETALAMVESRLVSSKF